MLTMIILFAVAALFLGVLGFGLRAFAKVIGWLIGMVVVFSVIGGMLGLIGVLARLTVKVLPVVLLIGIGILIGRRWNGRRATGRDFRDRARDAVEGCRNRAQDVYYDVRNHAQDIVDANGRVIR